MNQTRTSLPHTFWVDFTNRRIYYPYIDTVSQIMSVHLDGASPQIELIISQPIQRLDRAQGIIETGEGFYWINTVNNALSTERVEMRPDSLGYDIVLLGGGSASDSVFSGTTLWSQKLQQEPGEELLRAYTA